MHERNYNNVQHYCINFHVLSNELCSFVHNTNIKNSKEVYNSASEEKYDMMYEGHKIVPGHINYHF